MTSRRPSNAGGAPRRGAADLSIVADGMTVTGGLESAGGILINGTVHGDVRAATVCVGRTGRVAGAIRGDTVEVSGQVDGDIEAGAVSLGATARIAGDIVHASLCIEAGACVDVRSLPKAGRGDTAPVDRHAAN